MAFDLSYRRTKPLKDVAFLSNFDYFWEQSYQYLQRPHLSILCGLGTIQTLNKVKCTQFTRGNCLCKGNYRSSSEIFKLHSRICVHQKKSFFFTIWRRRCFGQTVTDRILSFARASISILHLFIFTIFYIYLAKGVLSKALYYNC